MSGPGLGPGIEVDPVTMQPLLKVEDDRRKKDKERHLRIMREGQALGSELVTGAGGGVLKVVLGLLEKRIDELMAKDEACQAYLTVLHALNYKTRIAPRKAEARMRSIMGDEVLETGDQAARKDSGL